MSKEKDMLTDAELEIMQVIWEKGKATVRDVYETLNERRKVAYTTVLTMMKLLEHKGFLSRDDSERTHVYRPRRQRQRVVSAMVNDFVERVFQGASRPLLMHLIEENDLSAEEIDQLAELARRKKQ
ncbi:MAG: BlaI/MecI/CopY family transcriptional regulator [Bryobacterales bacterium]|nr:BlaI/MecI/CopY family transcriptional regulator [Acidobacteriota bacterium]